MTGGAVGTFALAMLLGGAIGMERQWHQGMAGLRTNALVATASCAFVQLPLALHGDLSPAILAGSVISGIGFLGAGVILREGTNVRGLNTAATLWGSAAVGVYTGADLPGTAAALAGIILVINVLLRPVVAQLNRLGAQFSTGARTTFAATVDCDVAEQASVRALILERSHRLALHLLSLRSTTVAEDATLLRLHFELMGFGRVERTVEQLLTGLGSARGVSGFAWSRLGDAGSDIALHPES
ncbi:MgtC/SapB family protein [Roseomonas elaeocarpi]|uniref:Protein MgtC n=1 Tax=Roseomonas elaeocarpi TaxID=907779 RepID=A0ABV6K2W8_9PROT